MKQNLLSSIQSPFQRVRALLSGTEPGLPPIDMTIGEPRHGVPDMVAPIIAYHAAAFAKYPPIAGIVELRLAIASWLTRRFDLFNGAVDPDVHVVPLCGTREGLVSVLALAAAKKGAGAAVLMPNPFYQAYYAAAIAFGCDPVFLPATAQTGFLPDLDAIPAAVLDRTAAFYLASPANPQGAVASVAYLKKAIALARQHGFYLFADECYSEIYSAIPPASTLQAAEETFDRVLVFNSLSKRSNAAGLRSGFVAGDACFLKDYLQFRNVACPQIPLPIQHASAALWSDEIHVSASRDLYREKFAIAARYLSNANGFSIPGGGFFLWLDVSHLGGGEAAAQTIWKGYGVKTLPGAYLAQSLPDGGNPADGYVRLALVDHAALTDEAMQRLARVLL